MKKNFTDDEVVSVSQELDSYLVEFQRKMNHEQADRQRIRRIESIPD
ncbi:aspartyl-phosphate phosphatase Spo0E family protein [Paenibacillus dendritiformis]|nr:aspartyl-phosphate phosphatase Spo0E family protein [Paenibacillus dendritiformis]